jgi:hypothetical protein
MTASVANNAGNLYFLDGQGVSFGISTSGSNTTVTGSVIGGTLTGSYAGTVLSTASISGSNIVGSINTSGISLSVPNYVTQTGSVYFLNSSGNITWSSSTTGNSTYLYGSAPGGTGGAGGAALQGSGTYTQNTGTIQFANSNGVTFGLTNNQMTASIGNNVGSMYFADSNGVTFGVSTNTNNQSTVTASFVGGTAAASVYAGDNISVSTIGNSTSVSVINTTNFTYGHNSLLNTSQSSLFQLLGNSTLSLGTGYTTHTHNYQSTGAYLTTAALSNHSHGNVSLALTNVSGTTASASNGLTLSISAPNVGGAQTGISGFGVSNTTYTSGTIIVSGQNNITIGSSVNGASQYIRLSVPNFLTTAAASDHAHAQYVNTSASSLLQHTSATSAITSNAMHTSERARYFYTSNNTFANSTHSHGNISLALTNISGTTASASNGMTLSLSANTAGGGGGVAMRGSGTYIQSTGTIQFVNSNGLTFGLSNNGIMTASVANNVGNMGFGDANNVTFGIASTASNSSTVVTASIPNFIGTSISTSGHITVNANTAGMSLTAPTMGYLYFSNANGHSWSSSVSSVSTSIYIVTA